MKKKKKRNLEKEERIWKNVIRRGGNKVGSRKQKLNARVE